MLDFFYCYQVGSINSKSVPLKDMLPSDWENRLNKLGNEFKSGERWDLKNDITSSSSVSIFSFGEQYHYDILIVSVMSYRRYALCLVNNHITVNDVNQGESFCHTQLINHKEWSEISLSDFIEESKMTLKDLLACDYDPLRVYLEDQNVYQKRWSKPLTFLWK